MDTRRRKTIFIVLFILWTVFVLYASLAPGDELPVQNWWDRIPYFDKIVHFGFYFVEMVILLFLFDLKGLRQLWALAGILMFSGAVEIVQPFFGRSKDVYDLAANLLGALSAVVAVRLVRT